METVFKAQPRSTTGSRDSHALRREGLIPANVVGVVGEDRDSLSISINRHDFESALRQNVRVFQLEVEGEDEGQQVLLNEIQWDAMGDVINNVEFKRAPKGVKVQVNIELKFLGTPKARGEFVKQMADLEVECRPSLIPESISVQTSEMELEDAITVGDLEFPEGVESLVPAEEVICQLRPFLEEEEGDEASEGEESLEPELIGRDDAEPAADSGDSPEESED
ncbi:MAG TPA: 50S ribosomal protein L25 [Planctomycetes bacterium]|nr:50S ribosomal protein L25 [Planctomycetota bacterium]